MELWQSQTMKHGSQGDSSMIQLSKRGACTLHNNHDSIVYIDSSYTWDYSILAIIKTSASCIHFLTSSYLKTLLGPINEETNRLIEQLKPLADGVTEVPINIHFGDFTVDIISKVGHSSELTSLTQLLVSPACHAIPKRFIPLHHDKAWS